MERFDMERRLIATDSRALVRRRAPGDRGQPLGPRPHGQRPIDREDAEPDAISSHS